MPSEYSYLISYKKNPYNSEMIDALARYLESGGHQHFYRRQEQCTFFEKEVANLTSKKFAVSCSSGTAALHLAMLACNVKTGDEVILTPHVTYAVGNAVQYLNCKPVLVDFDDTLTIDPTKIEEKITSKTKCIIPVHTYGHPADMDPIMEIAQTHNLLVIEDITHAIGSKYKGKRLPVRGDDNIGIYSLGPSKQLWLPSGGGMLVTNNHEVAEKAKLYKSPHGEEVVGYSYLMSDLAAIVGRIQLRHLGEYVRMQREAAKILTETLKRTPVITPVEKEWAYHSYARYAIRTKRRKELMEYLKREGIDCHTLYPKPTHLLETYKRKFQYREGEFPYVEQEKQEELSLPEPRFRTPWEIDYIAQKIIEFFR